MQNKALIIVYKLPRMYSTISLYQNVAKTILPINGIYKMQLLVYMFKSIRNIRHCPMEFHINQTAFNTRNSSNLLVKRCILELTKQRIGHIGAIEYNQMPFHLKSICTISSFKTQLRQYLLQNIEMLLM
ncbi:uncharacterized protein LOC142227010 [Haematobia irritans]|uniref:uncharacterized protein LOC142227010 n=1 Tax=Haematobia irritans TaxID=7368 RepID=UPI003F50B19C